MYSSCVFLGSLAAATFLLGSHAHAGPSFNCNLARMPSEIQICQNPRLSELDNVLAAGYNFIKATRGLQAADAIGFHIGDRWDNVSRIETALPIGRLRKSWLFAT